MLNSAAIEVPMRTIHLLLVAAAAGLPLFCIALDLRRKSELAWRRAHRNLAFLATAGLLLGGLTGVLYGYLIWSRSLSSALQAVGSRLPFGIVEYLFTLVIYVGYAATFLSRQELSRKWHLFRAAMLFVAVTNLAYHFPTLLGIVRHLKDQGGVSPLNSSQFRGLAFSYPIALGSIHFLFGALIVASLIATWLIRDAADSNRFLRCVSAVSLAAMMAQWFSGLALYFEFPRNWQFQLTALWQWGGLPLLIGTAWFLTVCQIGLIFRPRSQRWLLAAAVSLAVLLIQMSWLGTLS
jgi:hypothetical protein